jgi:hypothetical protein
VRIWWEVVLNFFLLEALGGKWYRTRGPTNDLRCATGSICICMCHVINALSAYVHSFYGEDIEVLFVLRLRHQYWHCVAIWALEAGLFGCLAIGHLKRPDVSFLATGCITNEHEYSVGPETMFLNGSFQVSRILTYKLRAQQNPSLPHDHTHKEFQKCSIQSPSYSTLSLSSTSVQRL